MIVWVARFALGMLGRSVVRRAVRRRHGVPLVGTRKGRLALLLLGFALRRRRMTRLAGHALGLLRRWGR